MMPIRLSRSCCARAVSGHAAALPSVTKKFSPSDMDCHVTLPWGSCNGGDDITPGRAALRDFNRGYVGSGCAPWQGGAFQWVKVPPGDAPAGSSRSSYGGDE